MSNRRKAGVTNRTVAYIAAGVIHAALLAAMLFNYTATKHEKIEAHDAKKVDTINASLINEKDIKDQQAKLTKLEKDRQRKKREAEQRERDRLNEIKQQAKDQQKKVDDLKEQQKLEKAKTLELEKQREAIALKKKKEDDERKKKEAERKKKADEEKRLKKIEEQRVAKKKEADRIKREQEDYKERQRLNALLAEEEAELKRRAAERIAKERTATIQSQYSARIEAAVKRFWRVAPGTEASRNAKVNIKVSPLGDVISVRVLESSGLAEFDQSLEAAISQASPLPIATAEEDLEAHTKLQNLNITFKPY